MGDLLGGPLGYWHWWIAAAVFGALEMAVPGVVFLWLGLAAAATGFVVLAAPFLGWSPEIGGQLLSFAAFGLVSVAAGRQVWRNRPADAAHATLNRRGADLIGRTFPLERALASGQGRVKVGDTLWLVRGPDLPVGTVVRVVGVDGATLLVEPAIAGFTEP